MLSRLSVRGAATAASATRTASVTENGSTTSSGLRVASEERHGPLSHLVLAFRAGSRYEDSNQKGLVHHVRNFAGRDSQQFLGVPLLWSTASIGASMTSFATRDLVGVRVSVPRDSAAVALSILGHVAAQPSFKPWELEEIHSTLHTDLAYLTPFDHVFDAIHSAAYRNGPLAQSTIAPAHKIGKYSQTELQQFAARRLVSGQGVLVGINIDHDTLHSYADSHAPIESGKGADAKASAYIGGEVRKESCSPYAHVIIAGEGAARRDVKAVAAQSVLLATLGEGAPGKYGGRNGNGVIPKAVGGHAATSAFMACHSDSGLAGVYLLCEGASAGVATNATVKALKEFKSSELARAKAIAKTRFLVHQDSAVDYSTDRAAQVLSEVHNNQVIEAIGNVTGAEVEAAAKKLSSKLSIASYGSIDHVPYRDQL